MSIQDDAERILQAADQEWLTVNQFCDRYQMEPQSVYEAIRKGRLNFEVVRLTTGRHPRSIRIGPPKAA